MNLLLSKRKGFKMEYNSIVTLKDGRACTLRNGTASDGQAILDISDLPFYEKLGFKKAQHFTFYRKSGGILADKSEKDA